MKKFSFITVVSIFYFYSFTLESNINDLFTRCEIAARESNYSDFVNVARKLSAEIQNLPEEQKSLATYELDLIDIEALLNKGMLERAMQEINTLAEHFFPILTHCNDLLFTCLMDPQTHIDDDKYPCGYITLKLAYLLVRYYWLNDELAEAETLVTTLALQLEEEHEANDPFGFTPPHFSAKVYYLLANIYCLERQHADARNVLEHALSLLPLEDRSFEKGMLYLGEAELSILENNKYAARSKMRFAGQCLNESTFGTALLNLLHAQMDIRCSEITASTRAKFHKSLNSFAQLGDIFNRGLAYCELAKITGDAELADQYYRNAADLAQKTPLPLLARILK